MDYMTGGDFSTKDFANQLEKIRGILEKMQNDNPDTFKEHLQLLIAWCEADLQRRGE